MVSDSSKAEIVFPITDYEHQVGKDDILLPSVASICGKFVTWRNFVPIFYQFHSPWLIELKRLRDYGYQVKLLKGL